MGHAPPRVSVFAIADDRTIAEGLVLRLTTRRRRGELGAIRLHLVGEDARHLNAGAGHLAVVVLDREGALPGRLAHLLQHEHPHARTQVPHPRRGTPPLLDVPAPSRAVLLRMRAVTALPPGADPPGRSTVLPRDGLPLLGRDDQEQAWDRVLDELVSIAAEIPGFDEPEAPPLPDRPPFRVPFARDPGFSGRAAELARLDEHLGAGQIVSLRPSLDCGGSGAGVRALAVEYAYRRGSSFPGGVFWGTYSPERVFDSSSRSFEAWGAPRDAVSMTSGWDDVLAAADRPDVLLIADCGEARSPVQTFALLAARVLILTALHETSLPSSVIDVGPLDEEAALVRLLPFAAGDRDAAATLSLGLGRLPLALRLAAGHLAAHPDLGARRYLEHLALPEVDPTRSAALERTFALAVEPLRGTAAGALLQTIAALAGSEPQPPARLVLATGLDAAAATQALEQLIDRGLLARLTDGSVVLHRRLVSTARATIEEPKALAHTIARRVLAALSDAARLADEVLARGVSSVMEDLKRAVALLDPYADDDLRRAFAALEEAVGSAVRLDRDRPLSRGAFFEHLVRARDPWGREHGLPELEAQAAELRSKEPGPRLALRRWLPPAERRCALELEGCAALSTDGATALTVDTSGDVTLWDVRRTEPVRTVALESDSMRRVAVAADGLICAVATDSLSRIDLWDIVSGRCFHRIPISGGAEQFWALTLTPNGRFLAATTNRGSVEVIDLREPDRVRRRAAPRDAHRSGTRDASPLLSSDGSRLVLPHGDSYLGGNAGLWVWDLLEDAEWTQRVAPRPDRMLHSMRYPRTCDAPHPVLSADGRKVFSISPWRTLLTWDLADPGPPCDGGAFLSDVQGLAVTADGAHVVMLSSVPVDAGPATRWHRHCAAGSIQMLSAASGEAVAELPLAREYGARLVAAPDARNILILSNGIQFIEWVGS